MTESVALCLLGAAAGLVCARWLLGLVSVLQPPTSMRVALDLTLDPRVLGITMLVAMCVGMLAGLTPAIQATRPDLLPALRVAEGGWSVRRTRLRGAFVTTQLALSLVLVAMAGLFTRAVQRALTIDPGFDPRGVVVADIRLAPHGYDRERAVAFYARLLERLRARPEVSAATIARSMPLSFAYMGEDVPAPGETTRGRRINIMKGRADVGYFETMRVPIVAGRTFTAADGPSAPRVMVVNETFARRYWPGESPLGRSLPINGGPHMVVGVVRDGKYRGLDEVPRPYAYFPFAQSPDAMMTVYARARGDVGAALAAIRSEVSAIDPNIALEQAAPLTSQLDLLVLPQLLCAWLIGGFGLVGLTLAAIGLYGVVAYDVAQRTREYGIRLALGAGGGAVVRGVLSRALWIVGLGTTAGVAMALGAGHLARSFLFGVGPNDPVTLVSAPLLLAVVALIASYIPARRAARVDPMVSLRAE
jgi:predicted permease